MEISLLLTTYITLPFIHLGTKLNREVMFPLKNIVNFYLGDENHENNKRSMGIFIQCSLSWSVHKVLNLLLSVHLSGTGCTKCNWVLSYNQTPLLLNISIMPDIWPIGQCLNIPKMSDKYRPAATIYGQWSVLIDRENANWLSFPAWFYWPKQKKTKYRRNLLKSLIRAFQSGVIAVYYSLYNVRSIRDRTYPKNGHEERLSHF